MGRGRIRSGLAETWGRKLTPREDFIWRTVLERFASDGRPPSVQEIVEKIRVPDDEARTLLADLRSYDLLGLDESATTITYAYPFANTPTEHRVQLYRQLVHAVCAIDALGIARMFGTNTRIESCRRACGGRIEVRTAQNGKALGHYRPAEACCPAIAFFCSNEHLEQWLLAQSRKRVGSRLTLNEGLELSRSFRASPRDDEPALNCKPVKVGGCVKELRELSRVLRPDNPATRTPQLSNCGDLVLAP